MVMEKVIVNIGNKTYNCQVAKTEEQHRKGLMDVEYLAPDEGMLFEFKEEGVNFTPTDNSIVAIYKKGTTAAIKNIVKIYVSGTEVALKSDIVDTSNFATKEEIPDTSEFITSEDLPDTSNFATHDEIPDVSGLASTDYVNNSIDAVNAQIGLVNAELEEIINGGE
jgi:hypothetical protein